jgi:hypothetical protein
MYDACELSKGMRAEQVRSVIERCLPNGTSSADVKRFFLQNRVKHWVAPKGGEIDASIPRGYIFKSYTFIQVYLDSSGVVIGREVGPVVNSM